MLAAFWVAALSLSSSAPVVNRRVAHGIAARRTCQPVLSSGSPVTVSHFIRDLEYLGPCRFVVSGPGAILEAVGCFEGYREMKPGLATVSNDDKSFECHLRLEQIRGAQFARKEKEDTTLHIVRLLDGDSKTMLSAILHPEEGDVVEEGAVKFWDSLRQRFGDDVELVPDDA